MKFMRNLDDAKGSHCRHSLDNHSAALHDRLAATADRACEGEAIEGDMAQLAAASVAAASTLMKGSSRPDGGKVRLQPMHNQELFFLHLGLQKGHVLSPRQAARRRSMELLDRPPSFVAKED